MICIFKNIFINVITVLWFILFIYSFFVQQSLIFGISLKNISQEDIISETEDTAELWKNNSILLFNSNSIFYLTQKLISAKRTETNRKKFKIYLLTLLIYVITVQNILK